MAEDNNQKIDDVKKVFDIKVIRRGIILFVGLSLATLTAVFLYNNSGEIWEVWSQMHIKYLLLAIFISFMDMYLGALRNHIFVAQYVPGISQMVSFKANLANIFMGAVTPSQTGGGPAQWYINYRNNVSLADSVTVSVVNMVSTLIFFPLSGAFALYILKDQVPSGFITHLMNLAFFAFSVLGTIIIGSLLFPRVIGSILKGLGLLVDKFNLIWGSKVKALSVKADNAIKDYRDRFLVIMRNKPWLFLASLVLTFILYFNKYFLSVIILMSLGIDADFWTIISIQAIIQLLIYFAPSPGGTGIAELSITALMANIVSGDYLTTFTLLNRSFLFFIPALLGAFTVLSQLTKDSNLRS